MPIGGVAALVGAGWYIAILCEFHNDFAPNIRQSQQLKNLH